MIKQELGPNAKKLLIRFIAREAIPSGGGIIPDGLKFLLADDGHQKEVMDRALANMGLAITTVRSAPDNPHGDDEEAIAGALLEAVEQEQARRIRS